MTDRHYEMTKVFSAETAAQGAFDAAQALLFQARYAADNVREQVLVLVHQLVEYTGRGANSRYCSITYRNRQFYVPEIEYVPDPSLNSCGEFRPILTRTGKQRFIEVPLAWLDTDLETIKWEIEGSRYRMQQAARATAEKRAKRATETPT